MDIISCDSRPHVQSMRGSNRYIVQWRVQGRFTDIGNLVVEKPGEFLSTVDGSLDFSPIIPNRTMKFGCLNYWVKLKAVRDFWLQNV